MDTRNNFLIVGLYVAGAVVIAAAGLVYFAKFRPFADLADRDIPGAEFGATEFVPSNVNPLYGATIARNAPPPADVQSALALARDMLEKRTAALEQKNAECKALRAELDEQFLLILRLLDESAHAGFLNADTAQHAKVQLESELERLHESLDRSDVLDEERERQLEQLRAELIRADFELAVVEQQAQRELKLLQAERENLERAASSVVASCGMFAVAALTDLLHDERVEVRRWSARALGAIGPEAQESVAALRELLQDPDAVVRQLAADALGHILESPARPDP